MKSSKTWLIILLIVLIVIGVIFGIGYYKKITENKQNPIVTMNIKDYGTIKIELYPEMAPNTVANFIKLAQNGYYNGLTFHRVVQDFMIQGGDKKGDGTGTVTLKDLYPEGESEDEYCIEGEFVANNYTNNTLKFERGVIAMARGDYTSLSTALRTESYNSAGAQFFIMVKDTPRINGLYAAFGRVTEGMDIVDQIVALETVVETDEETGETTETDMPVNKPVIESVTVETFGKDYGNPETLEPFDYMSYLMSLYSGSLNTSEE